MLKQLYYKNIFQQHSKTHPNRLTRGIRILVHKTNRIPVKPMYVGSICVREARNIALLEVLEMG